MNAKNNENINTYFQLPPKHYDNQRTINVTSGQSAEDRPPGSPAPHTGEHFGRQGDLENAQTTVTVERPNIP